MFAATNQFKLDLGGEGEANLHALDDVLSFISGNTQIHIKTSMKTIKNRFMSAPYGFVEDDVHWLVARLYKRGDLTFTVNGSVVTVMNKSADEIVDYIIKKQYVDKLLMEVRVRVPEKEKKAVQTVIKELFGSSLTSEDEDSGMRTFQKYSQNRIGEMNAILVNYNQYAYPGKKIIEEGKKLMQAVVQITEPKEFYEYVSKHQDDLLDYAEDYEPVKTFFGGEQQQIFTRALDMLEIYDDSKTYIVDKDLEDIVAQIKSIVEMQAPYREIPKLPDLRNKFMNAYTDILEKAAVPVKQSIEDDRDRVIEVVDTKEYKDEKKPKYQEMFVEIWNGADTCNNVSRLRAYADEASALKIRLLDEMNELDAAIAAKKVAENAAKGDVSTPDVVVKVPQKKTKNVTIKTVAHTSSWRIEKAEDVDKYIDQLKKSLLDELNENDIVNVEF
jgi:hypothetical protein